MATGPPIFEDASFDPEMTGIMVEAYEKALPMASRHRTAERRQEAHRNKRDHRERSNGECDPTRLCEGA
jgi:hypothetical protein